LIKKNRKMKELQKIEKNIATLYTGVEEFAEKVKKNVEVLTSKLPTDLTTINVVEGDKMEAQVMNVYSSIDTKFKEYKKERLNATRQLDAIKKEFTSLEAEIDSENQKLKSWVENYSSEKLRRKRIEEEKLEAERQAKEKENRLYNAMINHYFNLSLISFRELKQKTENAYFGADTVEKLDNIVSRLKTNLSEEKIRAQFQKQRDLNVFEFDGDNLQDLLMVKEAMPKIEENEKKYITEYYDLCKYLVDFYPSQLEKIKNQNEEQRKLEAEKLKQKQAEDDAKMEAELEAKKKAEAQAKALEGLSESLQATPSVELGKGVSTKMKYYPENHAELLKIIQWYLGSEYAKEDFEKLNSRLYFMRTSADKAMNDFGEVIDGVTAKEDVRVRKTSK